MRPSFTANVKANALAATTAEVVLRVNAATDRPVDVAEIGVSFNGVDNTAVPVLVELLRLADNGTMTAVTPVKQNDSLAEGIGATAAKPDSAEPTTGDVLRTWYVHPQTGLVEVFPPDARPVVGGGDRIGIQCTAPAGVTCNVYLVGIE